MRGRRLLPLFVDVTGRRCVVVGGGTVGARRVRSLMDAGADVVVVAPHVLDDVLVARDAGALRLLRRAFEPADCDGAFLVIAATGDAEANAAVASAARERGILCNDATCPERGDAVAPSVLRRGDLLVAVTTGGVSPSLAARIRSELEAVYGPHYETLMVVLAEARELARQTISDRGRRRVALEALARDSELDALVRGGRLEDSRARARACILSSSD